MAQAAGWIEPDPYAVGVSALTDGIVRDVLVLEGQRVAVGEVVARLVDDDAKLAVRKAEADLASKQAELTAAQRQWDNPVERRRAVAAAKAALEETRAESAKVDADVAAERAREAEMADLATRLEKLVAARATPEQELVGLRFKLEAQRATIKAAEARRPVLAALVRQKEAEVAAAEENAALRIEEAQALQAGKAAVMQTEAALAEAKLRLYRTEVAAAKTAVKDGERVVIQGVVAGRADPVAENRAILTLLDSGIKTCDKNPADGCKTPWDACCEPADVLSKNSVTVQVVDAEGRPLKTSLGSIEGVKPLAKVVVSGLAKVSSDGVVLVNADGLYVAR